MNGDADHYYDIRWSGLEPMAGQLGLFVFAISIDD